MIKKFYVLALLAFLLASDLISKHLVFGFLTTPGDVFFVAPSVFDFVHVRNYGVSFGFLEGNTTILIVVTSIVCAVILAVLVLKPRLSWLLKTALCLMLGGALGNLVDRIAFGFVRDFINYTFLETLFDIRFAVGNIADIYVLVGAIVLIYYVVFDFHEEHFKGWRLKSVFLKK